MRADVKKALKSHRMTFAEVVERSRTRLLTFTVVSSVDISHSMLQLCSQVRRSTGVDRCPGEPIARQRLLEKLHRKGCHRRQEHKADQFDHPDAARRQFAARHGERPDRKVSEWHGKQQADG